jgi:hypothetical protein
VDVGVLFGLFAFSMVGSVDEQIEPVPGKYRVVVAGEGSGIANRLESAGLVRGGRLVPTTSDLSFSIRGRESRTVIRYHHERGLLDYTHVSHTFLLGRRREARDVLRFPVGLPVDDVVTATLNYARGALERDPGGAYRTWVVRRARPDHEGPDDVRAEGYRAEIVPLVLRVAPDPVSGHPVAQVDLTPFSSWARDDSPARIAFGPYRRPESIQARLMLGTTVRITFGPAAGAFWSYNARDDRSARARD